jgi:hypothetical protein
MKKRILSVLLVLMMLICILPGAAIAAGGFAGFTRVNTYNSGHYSDVATSAWYAAYAQAAYEYGLMSGTSDTMFSPDAPLTIAEVVKLAASIHSIYNTGTQDFASGTPWYRAYADYALQNGIIDADYAQYSAMATRSEFALILSKALPQEALSVKNSIEDNAIPDVPMSYSYAPAIYMLYRAGVLTGSDAQGRFLPNTSITRAEAAAIVIRMASAAYRQSVTLSLDLTTVEIFDKCSPAVFFVEILDINSNVIKTGSGFFIDPSGIAVTNFHVVKGGTEAVVTTSDGLKHSVLGLYDYSRDMDLALIQVDGDSFPYLEMAAAGTVATGADAWAIGSPLGFKNTISKGIISSASRVIDGRTYIQTTAAISPGSSGGALLDSAGRVIGVTTATAVGAQNINLALPIGMIGEMQTTKLVTMQSILPNTVYYTNYYPVPDFGAFSKTQVYKHEEGLFYYRESDISMEVEDALDGYLTLLEDNNFQFYGYAIESGTVITYYINTTYGFLVTFGYASYEDTSCIRVMIMKV